MTLWDAIFLGFLQGATEFLPVSSSGHLVVGQAVLGIALPGVTFEVALHGATLLSVVLVYRGRLGTLLVGLFRGRRDAWAYTGLLALGTLPAAAVGLLLRRPVEGLFEVPWVAGAALLLTGTLLWTTRRAPGIRGGRSPGVREALLMGVAQAAALVPGLSRSGTTVVVGLWLGVEATEAAAFSFLLAIPAILGAALLQVPDVLQNGTGVGGPALAVGALAAAGTGVAAIRAFVALLRSRTFHRFAPYCWALGGLFLVYLVVRGVG